MRKSITSFLMLFFCLPLTWAFNNSSELIFSIPGYWEYNVASDAYPFRISNNGSDFEGTIELWANDNNGNIYKLFSQEIAIASMDAFEQEYIFEEEIGLEPATYTFFFKYINENGEVREEVARGTAVVRAPSSVTRIPITTTTVPDRITLSSNLVRSQSHISVFSTVEMNEVSLVDMKGKIVRSKRISSEKEAAVNVDGLTKGNYIVVGKTSKGVLSTKLIKIEE